LPSEEYGCNGDPIIDIGFPNASRALAAAGSQVR